MKLLRKIKVWLTKQCIHKWKEYAWDGPATCLRCEKCGKEDYIRYI